MLPFPHPLHAVAADPELGTPLWIAVIAAGWRFLLLPLPLLAAAICSRHDINSCLPCLRHACCRMPPASGHHVYVHYPQAAAISRYESK